MEDPKEKIIKKTNCRTCGFFDGRVCRLGLGWKIQPVIGYCKDHERLRDQRCGRCFWFRIDESRNRTTQACIRWADYHNFYDSCGQFLPAGDEQDLRPNPDHPLPRKIYNDLYQFLKDNPNECKRRGITDLEEYLK